MPRASSAPRSRLLVATRSQHKLRELRELLGVGPDVDLVSPDDVGIEGEPDETGRSFETNARIKARYYAARSGLPTLADDSGLEVDALEGAPGVYTRRYAGPDATDADNNAKLLRALAGLEAEQRGARYVCVLALALPGEAGPRGALRIITRRGTCRGRIATAPKGDGGFGYDPIFEPASEPPGGQTLGEWSAEAKNAISHRSRAAARMAPVLRWLTGRRGTDVTVNG
jgi:XTP/dITP diphosphohydrolase